MQLNNLFSNFKAVVTGGIVSIVLVAIGFFLYSGMKQNITVRDGQTILAGSVFADLNEFKKRGVSFTNLTEKIGNTFNLLNDTRVPVTRGSTFYKDNPFSSY